MNLLAPLVALLEERQVSRAAARVGLSQPAMSRALQRLRRILDDPLLIRDQAGFRLTARAEDVYRQLTTLVPHLETLLRPVQFDPLRSMQPVVIAGTDYAAHAYGPAIVRSVREQAPAAAVQLHSWRAAGVADQIRSGTVDLGLYGSYVADDLNTEVLLVEEFRCVVAADHPLSKQPRIPMNDYLRFDHVIVDVESGVQPDVDFRLREFGRSRTAAITVPYHAVVPQLLPGTTLIATLPTRFIETWPHTGDLHSVQAPEEIETMPYRMVWHPAFDNDQRHRWLRQTVRFAVTGPQGS